VPWGVCKRRDKIARYVIANDRDAAMSGRWDGPELTGQIDPKPSFRLTPPLQHRLALADEASEPHHEELETASRFVSMMITATAWSSTDR
jgi:hypothetical protein